MEETTLEYYANQRKIRNGFWEKLWQADLLLILPGANSFISTLS